MDYKKRIQKVIDYLKLASCDCYLITNLQNIRYLSGFDGSAADILITKEKAFFFTDGRYHSLCKEKIPSFFKLILIDKILPSLLRVVKKERLRKMVVEAENLTIDQYKLLKENLPVKIIPKKSYVMQLRMTKDIEEIKLIREAQLAANEILDYGKNLIKEGLTEKELSILLKKRILEGGFDICFEPIVASGSNTCHPHAKPTEKKIKNDEIVIIDVGVCIFGYCSDLTRFYYEGELEIIEKYLKCFNEAKKFLKKGEKISKITKIFYEIFLSQGFDKKNIKHQFGHGIGLSVHEPPSLSKDNSQILKENMVICFEPGVYFDGKFGIRKEEIVII